MNTTFPQSRTYIQSVYAVSKSWYIHDSPEEEGHNILENYIKEGYEMFSTCIYSLVDFDKPFTLRDEKHLKRMLELLIDARKTWEEEHK